MISILIPVYNQRIASLVKELQRQVQRLDVPAEIRVLDDASDFPEVVENENACRQAGIAYTVAPRNMGRQSARLALASQATYDWLLFLDADSIILRTDFLEAYRKEIRPGESEVILGGRVYPSMQPADKRLRLHWKYGNYRERITEENGIRQGPHFLTNNFLIPKDLFLSLGAQPQLRGYGHEDTWWGIRLRDMGVSIRYIPNPIEHGELVTAETFLLKTSEAIRNLHRLSQVLPSASLEQSVRLYRTVMRFRKRGVESLIRWMLSPLLPGLKSYFIAGGSSLFLFDLYRLGYYLQIAR